MLRRLAQAGLLRVITNFRHQRVAEVWPLNGLREDFRVDTAGRLLSEEGVGSLTNQFPRPVREYVWLGAHPVAVLEATESAAGAVTPKGVTFVHSGHLGEPLTETDESGRVLRQYFFTPFGERRELGAVASPVSFATASPYTNHSKAVPVPAARATKLHFTELALASCDSIVISDGYGGPVVAEIPASASGDFWTEWLATDNAYVELRAKGCGTARGFSLVEALPEWGGVSSLARTDSTAHPYPAAGQHFRVSLGSGGFVRLKDLNVASCDAVEARTPSGQTLWKWTPLPSVYQVWTPRLVGDVDIGIWGQGCNGTERKFGFTLAEERRDSGAVQPVSIGLPGQRSRADGTIENWYRNYDASLGRYLSPEPLLQTPTYPWFMAQSGTHIPTYAYALNNPLKNTEPTGLYALGDECPDYAEVLKIARRKAGCDGAASQCRDKILKSGGCDICEILKDGEGPLLQPTSIPIYTPEGDEAWGKDDSTYYGGVAVIWKVKIARRFCMGNPEALASLMIHEGMHACKNFSQRTYDPLVELYNQTYCQSCFDFYPGYK